MTIKPSSHPSAGWHKGDCHPSSRRSLCCSCAISSLSTRSTEWLHMAMWQVFFPPFSWFPSLENGLWNLHGAHRDTELGAQKGSHCSAPAACTSPQPPPAALPSPAGLPRHLPCWVFTPAAISSATLHRGLRETQLEKPSFWRAKRIIAWKP